MHRAQSIAAQRPTVPSIVSGGCLSSFRRQIGRGMRDSEPRRIAPARCRLHSLPFPCLDLAFYAIPSADRPIEACCQMRCNHLAIYNLDTQAHRNTHLAAIASNAPMMPGRVESHLCCLDLTKFDKYASVGTNGLPCRAKSHDFIKYLASNTI